MPSTRDKTYGLKKQGEADFTYLHTRGYYSPPAVIAETGEVVHILAEARQGVLHEGRPASLARPARMTAVQAVSKDPQ